MVLSCRAASTRPLRAPSPGAPAASMLLSPSMHDAVCPIVGGNRKCPPSLCIMHVLHRHDDKRFYSPILCYCSIALTTIPLHIT